MTDATQKDLEQDSAIRRAKAKAQAALDAFAKHDADVRQVLQALNDRITAIEDTLVAEGRIRDRNLMP